MLQGDSAPEKEDLDGECQELCWYGGSGRFSPIHLQRPFQSMLLCWKMLDMHSLRCRGQSAAEQNPLHHQSIQ